MALVSGAAALRWAIGDHIAGAPFLTFYPVIVLVTLVGGLWPGALAAALSALVAWYVFLPLGNADLAARVTSTAIFALLSGFNVVVVGLLNTAVGHVIDQEANLRILIESAPTGIVVVDDEGIVKLVNSSTEKLFGYRRAELLGRKVEELIPHDRAASHVSLRTDFFRRPEARPMGVGLDLRGLRKDGTEFPVEVALNPVQRKGRTSVLATVIDITDRIRVRDSQQMVIRELQHRTKNLFAVFQAIVSQSLEDGRTSAEARAILNGRIQALSEAYDALANSGWGGAPLSEIVDRQLAGFSSRVTMTGCDVVVGPSVAQQFALLAHELATNATKYGALSSPEGRVSIEGRVDRAAGDFSFRWSEKGGPLVVKPTRKGFGSFMLLDAARSFARSVDVDFDPQGLRYELHIDLAAIELPSREVAHPMAVRHQLATT